MLISLLIGVIVIGLLYWLVSLIPLPAPFPTVVKVIAIIILVLYVLQAFGLWNSGITI
jgi:hypothetical protein